MTESDFQTSEIWGRTLAFTRRDPYAPARERLRASYQLTREHAATLLGELARTSTDFTVHDITHVDALWETADLICGADIQFTPAEAYVLGCGFVLHDAAMGLAAYKDGLREVMSEPKWRDLLCSVYLDEDGRWPSDEDLGSPPLPIVEAAVSRAIRETHASQAARLVDQCWTTTAGNEFHLLQDTALREAYGPLIGDLASSHWWSTDELVAKFRHTRGSLPWQPSQWTIDPLKIACVLRLADATQLDSRRAPTFLYALRGVKGGSRDHWRFQEHMSRPQLMGDRVTFTALRPFSRESATAWWLSLDYLRQVDAELKKVDALMHDLGGVRFAARAVAGVDSPERFAELFPVHGWRPVDANFQISDVRALIVALGGEQLYGRESEVAVRELIQNAQDAVAARRVVDPSRFDGCVQVRLIEEENHRFVLEVSDDGIGMDEEIIVRGLLDFGSSGWRTSLARTKFSGLLGSSFRPRGRFGIGFFSVFMLGDDVEVTTRRFDAGIGEARKLRFTGRSARPLLTSVPDCYVAPGTTVRIKLDISPYDRDGIFKYTEDDLLEQLVTRLVIGNAIPIQVFERSGRDMVEIPPIDLATATTAQVFDRLYPARKKGGEVREQQRKRLREEFVGRATEILATDDGRRIGLALLGRDFVFVSDFDLEGVVVVGGFRADSYAFFSGYFVGKSNRASRDNVDFEADGKTIQEWLGSQEERLRSLGIFDQSLQLENCFAFHRGPTGLKDDHHVGMTSAGLIQAGEIAQWALERAEVVFSQGWPLAWDTRPARVVYYPTGQVVPLPDNWIVPFLYLERILDEVLPEARDPRYESARYHTELTWQKMWWRMSGRVSGLIIRKVCEAWNCEVDAILASVAERNWSDFADLGVPGVERLPVFILRRPN